MYKGLVLQQQQQQQQLLLLLLFTAIGLLPGGSGYFTCKQNMKLVTTKACSGNLEPSQHLILGTGKPRKTCVEMAGRRTF